MTLQTLLAEQITNPELTVKLTDFLSLTQVFATNLIDNLSSFDAKTAFNLVS